ncbi:MAG: transcriptional regulator, LuxR family [Frankiales bacterium]|nr:transcriptional regulator, LuxR family [Frankiales bacterium]
MPVNPQPLFGRADELALLREVLVEAQASRASRVLLGGDAGVGKTRLLIELSASASELGMLELVGHCIDFGDVGLPYLPFSEAFGRLNQQQPALFAEVLRRFAPIGRLLPDRRTMSADEPNASGQRPPNIDSDESLERSELFAAVAGALRLLGEGQPVLLLLEDLHWADQSSRDLVGFLLNRLSDERVAVVASYRSDDLSRRHPLRPALASWARLPNVQRIQLNPLGDDVARLLLHFRRSDLSESSIQGILHRAEGNAFYLEELVDATDAEPDAVPAALADLLLLRLESLSEPARETVRFVAVAGRRVTHELLSSAMRASEGSPGFGPIQGAQLDLALREASDAHILQVHEHGRYGFRHALFGEAVYDDLLPGERVRIHAAFASSLGDLSIGGTAAELARHARESHDLDTSYLASIRAGDEALRVAAPQEAMQHFEAALELMDRLSPGVMTDRVALAVTTADAAAAAGHVVRALALVRDVNARMPSDAPVERRARLLLAIGTHASMVEGELEALDVTAEAIKLLAGDPPSELRSRLAAAHARVLGQLGRDEDALRWATESVELADEIQLPEVATDARTTIAVIERRAGDPKAAARQLEELVNIAHRDGQSSQELRTLFQLGMLRFTHGDTTAAVAAYERGWRLAEGRGLGWASFGLDARVHLAATHFVSGDWAACVALTDLTGQDPPPLARAKVVAASLAVRAARGDRTLLDELPELRRRWSRDGLIAIMALSQAAELHTHFGEIEAALADVDELTAVITEIWQLPSFMARIRSSALGLTALCKAMGGATPSARGAAVDRGAELHSDAHKVVDLSEANGSHVGPEGRAWLIRADAEWGRLCWLSGLERDEAAVPAAEPLISRWRESAAAFAFCPYEQARSNARLSSVLYAAGQTEEAAALIASARAVADHLTAPALTAELDQISTAAGQPSGGSAAQSRGAQSRAAQAHASDATGRSPGPAGRLTVREQEVLEFVALGDTNRQIARRLYISDKTVSVHVSNILAKLGVASRTEAAAAAHRDGLIAENRPLGAAPTE